MSSVGFVKVYTVDPHGAATPVMVDPGNIPFTLQPVTVTLTADCLQHCPPGWVRPPSQVGVADVAYFEHVIPAGTVMVHFASVAAALIAAGAATAV